MSILFLQYPPCSTCKRARKWLDDHGISYEARHIKEQAGAQVCIVQADLPLCPAQLVSEYHGTKCLIPMDLLQSCKEHQALIGGVEHITEGVGHLCAQQIRSLLSWRTRTRLRPADPRRCTSLSEPSQSAGPYRRTYRHIRRPDWSGPRYRLPGAHP